MRILLLFLSMLVAGCATFGNEALLNDQLVEKVKVGETTKAQLLEWFGAPWSTTKTIVNGKTTETLMFGYGHGVAFGNTETRVVFVNLDVDGVVTLVSTGGSKRDGLIVGPLSTYSTTTTQ